ncbi:hypothetical protein [Mycobacterium sp. MMS18-G62]
MDISRRLAIAAMVAAATSAAVAGCTSTSAPLASGTATTSQAAPATSRPWATWQTPKPKPQSPVSGIDVRITAEGGTTVRPGGPPIRFNVTMANNGADLDSVGMVVSMGHCSCSPGGAAMMPSGSMHMLDPQTNTWVSVPYVAEGTGMDYITANLVPPFPLAHNQTVSYELEMQLDPDDDGSVKNGESTINVTPTDPANPMRHGFRYAKYLPITVEP